MPLRRRSSIFAIAVAATGVWLVGVVGISRLRAADAGNAAAPQAPLKAAADATPHASSNDAPSAERGRAALLGRHFTPPVVTRAEYDSLWKAWGLSERPADFDRQVMDRYGLHPAPYANGGLPMGLRPIETRRGQAVGVDCMVCHGGSIFGQSIVGLANTAIDMEGLFRDLGSVEPTPDLFPYRLSNVRGTTEATASGVFLVAFRDGALNFRLPVADLGPIPDQLCEDAPAWWLLKHKRTMYHNGQIDARAVRPLMTFMLGPSATPKKFHEEEPTFRDIQAFLHTIEPPKYPLPIDASLASRGKVVFEANCASCHGSYGPDRDYPNKVIALEKIGTDPGLIKGLSPKIEAHFRESWLSREPGPDGKPYPLRYNEGYQAPPLDGVWATAPYLHNGSVPTLWALLKSADRPKLFTRSYRTGKEDYDDQHIGWKFTTLDEVPRQATKAQLRAIYDTTKPGRSNAGHTYGDKLSDDERKAVIEYLKTL
jgi:cytochrome c553